MSASVRATVEIDGRAVTLSNPEKVLWPEDGITKGELVAYYREIAEYIVPHLADRPLTLERYPDGIAGESFFEKHAPRGVPDWVPTIEIPSEHGKRATTNFVICNDEATLAYVANLGSIVLHVWTSKASALDVPEFVFFDLDPHDGCTIGTLGRVAIGMRDVLRDVGLEPLVKSSGGSGLHVVVPLAPDYTYDACKTFAEIAARALHDRLPELTTLLRAPARRPLGTVYLDYVQVGRGKTLVAPYSARPRAEAPVSMTLDWSEIEPLARKRAKGTEAEFARYTLKNALRRLKATGDLWGGPSWHEQRLEAALERARTAWR